MFRSRFLSLLSFLPAILASNAADRCAAMKSFSLKDTVILEATYLLAGSNVTFPEGCPSVNNAADICHIYGMTNTTSESSTKFDAWLPDVWHGRYLFTGSDGLGGCVDYLHLDYGSAFGFAAFGADNGHQGGPFEGQAFLNNPNAIVDYSYRGAHAAAVVGKEVVKAYYHSPPSKSYYLGCSSGGRQAVRFALSYPDIFDGILAGSPLVDWNHQQGWFGMLSTYTGANTTETFIPADQWTVIIKEILNQCDHLDGLVDGLIASPDDCKFDPDVMLCGTWANDSSCLTEPQVDALHKIYTPLYGEDGELIYPRYDPGAEGDTTRAPFDGSFPLLPAEWFRNAIYNDSEHSFDDFSLSDIAFADSIDPSGISTWSGDFSAFKKSGGKFMTYHGTRDAVVPHGKSTLLYKYVSSTLGLPNLDSFYRLFLVPGMGHCSLGPGAWTFGEDDMVGGPTIVNDTSHNILLAMVDWVENGNAPDYIIGTDANSTERMHCRYPYKSWWNGEEWTCK